MKKLILSVFGLMMILCSTVHAQHVAYISREVPKIDSSFKTYMGEHTMAKYAPQHQFLDRWGYVDSNGFYRCSAEEDWGVKDDYYLVAMGSYYSTTLGDKFRITTDTGNVFYVALTEFKANIHTDSKNQYSVDNKDIIEFVVDTSKLMRDVKYHGSANVYPPLSGKIAKIEEMNFIHE